MRTLCRPYHIACQQAVGVRAKLNCVKSTFELSELLLSCCQRRKFWTNMLAYKSCHCYSKETYYVLLKRFLGLFHSSTLDKQQQNNIIGACTKLSMYEHTHARIYVWVDPCAKPHMRLVCEHYPLASLSFPSFFSSLIMILVRLLLHFVVHVFFSTLCCTV